jgi:hypothetical protein
MALEEILEKLNEALLHESWDIVIELVGELEADSYMIPYSEMEEEDFE